MIAYLDTSALVKLYHQESNSDLVEDFIRGVEEIHLSEITKLEFRSAIWKKVRTGEVREENAVVSIDSFRSDAGNYAWVAADPGIISSAQDLLMAHGRTGLRTLDSIQLASVLTLKEQDCTFVTFDNSLKRISQLENVSILS